MTNVVAFDSIDEVRVSREKYVFDIFFKKLLLKIIYNLHKKSYELQKKIIKDCEELVDTYYESLTELIKDMDLLISKLIEMEHGELYVEGITELEDKLDKIQMQLLKIKQNIHRNIFRDIKEKRVSALINKTNRNINIIIELREKIEMIDRITNGKRFRVEINKKVKSYNYILLLMMLISFILGGINLKIFSRVSAVASGLIVLIALIGININKKNIFKYYLQKYTPRRCNES